MNTLDLELIGGDESELTALVSAFVRQERRLPRHEDLVAMRDHRHATAGTRTCSCARPPGSPPA